MKEQKVETQAHDKKVMGADRKPTGELNRWVKSEALKMFLNFFARAKNYDNDIFAPVVEYISPSLWKTLIRDCFTKKEFDDKEVVVGSSNLNETLYRLVTRGEDNGRARAFVVTVVKAAIAKFEAAATEDEPFRARFAELVATLNLSPLEAHVLFACTEPTMIDMLDSIPSSNRFQRRMDNTRDIARAVDATVTEVKGVLRENSKLIRYGILGEGLSLAPNVREFLVGFSDEPFSNAFFTRDTVESLPLAYFSKKLREDAANIMALVKAAKGQNSVNVLCYGVPGTGKTSLARTLAKALGRDCYFISQSDIARNGSYARTPPQYRYGAVNICDSQVNPEKSLIVVDEADDLLNPNGDKGLLNTVLDDVRTPVIWIANSPVACLDRSNCRRFDYSIRFKALTERERLMVWKNCVKAQKAGKLFKDAVLTEFAARYEVSAGGIARVLANVMRQHPRTTTTAMKLVEKYMTPHCELLGVKLVDEKLKPAKDYSLEGINVRGDVKLEDIVAAVRKFRATTAEDCPDRPRMNILLSGAPGTGKTEFVKYLSSILNQKLIVKMGSDLLGSYVGQTEANIRHAFDEAEQENRVLFFDEVDGIVQSRATAQASWETTKVNEVLHQMENFNGVFIAATNYLQNLDEAVMRRFTFRLTFDWLAAEGKKHFWNVFFKTPLTAAEREELLSIPQLTPADFRNVRQKFWYLDRPITNAERLAALCEEVAVKPRDSTEAHMGF